MHKILITVIKIPHFYLARLQVSMPGFSAFSCNNFCLQNKIKLVLLSPGAGFKMMELLNNFTTTTPPFPDDLFLFLHNYSDPVKESKADGNVIVNCNSR